MKTLTPIAALVLIAASASACSPYETAPATASSQSAETLVVTGALTYRERIALPPGSVATVTLSDISRADAPATTLAERRIELRSRQVPVRFELSVGREELQPRRRYAVRGTIHGPDGDLLWTTDTAHIVDPAAAAADLGTLIMVHASGATARLEGAEWIVEDIGGRGIIDRSRVTLTFADGRMAGQASCNRYNASYDNLGMGRIEIGDAAVTRMACAPALMNQEAAFLELLGAVDGYRFSETGALVLQTSDGERIVARR